MNTVAVIDYGMGNLHSVAKALEHVAAGALRVRVTHDEKEIATADRVVFPGVGAMRDCMAEIRRLGLDEILRRFAAEKPVLAICVGMQALFERSEENGGVDCIGLFPGQVRRFRSNHRDTAGERLKVPHMGWNTVRQTCPHPLWQGIADDDWFYFVHSYYTEPAKGEAVAGSCVYGEPFCAAIARENVFAVQFHPEKSQDNGLKLLQNFLSWDGREEGMP